MADWTLTQGNVTYDVVGGNATIPRCGLWVADLLLSSDSAPAVGQGAGGTGESVTLTIRGTSRVGAVVRSGAPTQRASCRVVGGAGKLGTVLEPRDYRGQSLDQVVSDCLRDAGESIGDLTALASISLAHWTRVSETASRSLCRLFRKAGGALVWRVARNGAVTVPGGTAGESWPTLDVGDTMSFRPAEDSVVFAPESGDLEPGYSVDVYGVTRRVDRVTYTLSGRVFRAHCQLIPV